MTKKILVVFLIISMVFQVSIGTLTIRVLAEGEPSIEFAGGSGTEADPWRIETADQLDGVRYHPEGYFILNNPIDLSDWNGGNGWTAIGLLLGSFDGNEKVISGLRNQPLFGHAELGSEIKNVYLESVNVTGNSYTGGLVNFNDGLITNCYVVGTIEGTGFAIGGLVGLNEFGTIDNSYAIVSVRGTHEIGGLVGFNEGTIINSYSQGSVEGNYALGGLVGYHASDAAISGSYSTVNVIGEGNVVGGLVGHQLRGSIINSYAEGDVEGLNAVGGLVGSVDDEESLVENSYATGNVNGNWFIGGLAGENFGTITKSYATGEVSGRKDVGGLVGANDGLVNNAYATGSVTGIENNNSIGGLIGGNYIATIEKSYATGIVTGTDQVGGLVGYSDRGSIIQSFALNPDIITPVGAASVGRIVGAYSQTILNNYAVDDMQQMFEFVIPGTDLRDGATIESEKLRTIFPYLDYEWDFMHDWKIELGQDYPILRSGSAVEELFPSKPSISTSNGTLIDDLEYSLFFCEGNSPNLSALLGANTKFLRWIEIDEDYSVDLVNYPVYLEGTYEIEVASDTGHSEKYTLSIDYGTSLTIEVTPEDGGTVLDFDKGETVLDYAGCYAPTSDVALMALSNSGFSFGYWEKDGNEIGNAEVIEYEMPEDAGDVTLVANFIPLSGGGEPEPSADAYLDTLSVNHGAIAPGFDPDTRGYALILPNNSTSVTFTATTSDPNSTMKIRVNEGIETALTSGDDSELSILSGDIITITVIAPDETTEREYTFTVAMEEMRPVNLELGQSELNWAKVIGSYNNNITQPKFIQTTDGGILAAGTLQSKKVIEQFGYLQHTNVIQLVKMNTQGEKLWSSFLSGLGHTSIQDIKQTLDGGYIVLGKTSITPTGDSSIPSYIYLVRLDANGNVLWDKAFREGFAAQTVLVETDGFITVANNLSGTYLIKTDSLGEEVSFKEIGGVESTDIKATNDGGYILIGQDTNYKSYLVKLNSTAQESWRLQLDYEDFTIYSVIEDTDGYVFLGYDWWEWPTHAVIGKTKGFGSFNNPPTLMWTNSIDDFDPEGSQSLVKGMNGNYNIVGTRYVSFNNRDIIFHEIDPSNGTVIGESTKIFSGSSNGQDSGFAIVQTNNGNLIIGGTTISYDNTQYMLLLSLIGVPIPTYTVSFDTTGGSTVSTQTVSSGEFVNKPPNPTKDNFTFDGWYQDVDLTTEWDFAVDIVNEDITLYAKWIVSGGSPTINLIASPTTSTTQPVTITSDVTDNHGVAELKWASGDQNVEFFAIGGTVFTNSFTVNSNGTYTVYARNTVGNATVKTITINNINSEPRQTTYTIGTSLTNPANSLIIYRDSHMGQIRLYFSGE